MISEAPWSLAFIVVLAVTATWKLLKSWQKQEIDAANARVALADERVKGFDRVIRDQRPTKTAFSDLDNQALFDRTMDLVARLREHGAKDQQEEREIAAYDKQFAEKWGESTHAQMMQIKKNERAEKREVVFQSTFKIDAALLRNELLARLPNLPDGGIWGPGREYRVDFSTYEKITYAFQYGMLADSLEGLAKQLPITPPDAAIAKRVP